MIRIRPLIACGIFASLLACAEGSKVETVQPDRPANFKLDTAAAQPKLGDLVQATHVVSLSAADLASGKLGPVFAGFSMPPKNGIHIYKVTYQSQTPKDPATGEARPVIASGLMLVPDSKAASYPWLILHHGTIASKVQAPSVSPQEGLFEAALGFITLVPDYIGYGSSSLEVHPYLIGQAYVNASLDMLNAAYQFADNNALSKSALFLKGYSEGGYATLAVQREIELNRPELKKILAASAPTSGPYNMEQTGLILLKNERLNPINLPLLGLSYNRWLSNNDFDLSNAFNVPVPVLNDLFFNPKASLNYDVIAGTLAPKDTNGLPLTENGAIVEPLTKALMKATFVDSFLNDTPDNKDAILFRKWTKEQSLTQGWKPSTPTILMHCTEDLVVPVKVTRSAIEDFAFSPEVPNPYLIVKEFEGPYNHGNCPAIFAPTLGFLEILTKLPTAK